MQFRNICKNGKYALYQLTGKLLSSENMEVEMLYGLTAVLSAVGDYPETVCKVKGLCDFGNLFKYVLYIRRVFGCYLGGRAYVDFGNHKNVYLCHGADVVEGENHIVFVNLF